MPISVDWTPAGLTMDLAKKAGQKQRQTASAKLQADADRLALAREGQILQAQTEQRRMDAADRRFEITSALKLMENQGLQAYRESTSEHRMQTLAQKGQQFQLTYDQKNELARLNNLAKAGMLTQEQSNRKELLDLKLKGEVEAADTKEERLRQRNQLQWDAKIEFARNTEELDKQPEFMRAMTHIKIYSERQKTYRDMIKYEKDALKRGESVDKGRLKELHEGLKRMDDAILGLQGKLDEYTDNFVAGRRLDSGEAPPPVAEEPPPDGFVPVTEPEPLPATAGVAGREQEDFDQAVRADSAATIFNSQFPDAASMTLNQLQDKVAEFLINHKGGAFLQGMDPGTNAIDELIGAIAEIIKRDNTWPPQ